MGNTTKIDPLNVVGLRALGPWDLTKERDGVLAIIAAALGASQSSDEAMCLLVLSLGTLAGHSDSTSAVLTAVIAVIREMRDSEAEIMRPTLAASVESGDGTVHLEIEDIG